MPSSERLWLAPVGQTVTQGASSQCRQDFGKCTICAGAFSGVTSKVWIRFSQAPDTSAP
jgi:hypothetical protein